MSAREVCPAAITTCNVSRELASRVSDFVALLAARNGVCRRAVGSTIVLASSAATRSDLRGLLCLFSKLSIAAAQGEAETAPGGIGHVDTYGARGGMSIPPGRAGQSAGVAVTMSIAPRSASVPPAGVSPTAARRSEELAAADRGG